MADDAKRDNNRVPTLLAASSSDQTPVRVEADPTTKRLLVSTIFSGVDTLDLTANDALVVAIVDGNGDQITSFGGGTQYAVDGALGATPTGNLSLAKRDDALSALTPIEGDAVELRVGSTGALWTLDVNSAANLTAAQAIQAAVEGTLTVSGTVAVTGVATAANQTTIIGHVDGIEGLLTTIDADTGGILTAVQLIDNAIDGTEMQVDVVAALPAGDNNIGNVDVVTLPTSIQGPGNPTIDSLTHVAINLAAGANQVLVSSAANKQIWVYALAFTVNVAGTVSFQNEDDVAVSGIMNFAASGGMTIGPSGNFAMPIWKLGTDKDLEVDIVTLELDGWLTYAIVSV